MTALEEVAHIATVALEIEVLLDRRWMKMSEVLASRKAASSR